MSNRIIDPTVDFHDNTLGAPLIIQRSQEIPQEYLDGLKQARDESSNRKMGNWHRVASIPMAIYDAWLREGFDVQNETAPRILAKLRASGLDYFITTAKAI